MAYREDAQKVFRRYWEYTPPIREFMAATSKEAIQVLTDTNPVHPHDRLEVNDPIFRRATCTVLAEAQCKEGGSRDAANLHHNLQHSNVGSGGCVTCREGTGRRGAPGLRRRMHTPWRLQPQACATEGPIRPSFMSHMTSLMVRMPDVHTCHAP